MDSIYAGAPTDKSSCLFLERVPGEQSRGNTELDVQALDHAFFDVSFCFSQVFLPIEDTVLNTGNLALVMNRVIPFRVGG